MNRRIYVLLLAAGLAALAIVLGAHVMSGWAKENVDDDPPGTAASPELTLSLRSPSLAVGSEIEAEVVLNRISSTPVSVQLISAQPQFLQVEPAVVLVRAGRRSAIIRLRALAAGPSAISASAPRFKPATQVITAMAAPAGDTLREAGAQRRLLMGAAAAANEFGYPSPLQTEPAYSSVLGSQYNMLEPENAMKWIAIHPEQDRFDFGPPNQLVDFAVAHQMKIRGHTLCWGSTNPKWLDSYKTRDPALLAEILHRHIKEVVSHYRGRVFAWDVVNEAIDDRTSGDKVRLKDSIWYNQPGIGMTGTGFIEQSFRWAHEADPDALLFYNENNIEEPGSKFDATYRMLVDLLARGVPITGVGIQAHLGKDGLESGDGLAKNIRRLTDLGLQVHLTEIDVPVRVDANGRASRSDLDRQAETYKSLLRICLRNPGCTAFQTWGFTDKHSWVPAYMPGLGAALPFDVNYQPKPAYYGLMEVLKGPPGKGPD